MLSSEARKELEELCRSDDKLLGKVFNLLESGISSNKEIVAKGGGANTGAVWINREIIEAILKGKIPNSSNISTYAYRAINRLLKSNPSISRELSSYLNELVVELKAKSLDEIAIMESSREVEKGSQVLENILTKISNAIYVYSYPTYLRVGTVEDPELSWFKIGFTDGQVGTRVLSQARQTAMPEDPVIVRVYHKEGISAQALESKFHQTLDAFKQSRSSHRNQRSGREWFATDLERLDAIAQLLELNIEG